MQSVVVQSEYPAAARAAAAVSATDLVRRYGENDTAVDVFYKVADAAELILARSVPLLIAGSAARRPQDLSKGEYCGRRRPEDGRIDWSRPAREIHNLVRAVAPPFPGAFAFVMLAIVFIRHTPNLREMSA